MFDRSQQGEGTSTATRPNPEQAQANEEVEPQVVLEELLVEDVSIDGMCGVY